MSTKKLGGLIFGAATLIVIAFSIYKALIGKEVGFSEVVTIGILAMMFLSSITWGSKDEKDGIYLDEELGQKISEESAKMAYSILLVCILIVVGCDKILHGTVNIFLLLVLALAMIILPLVEFFMVRKYESN